MVAHPRLVVFPGFSDFLHHVGEQNSQNLSVKNVYIKSMIHSGDGNVRILRQSCTSGYKYETFRICSLILSNKYFLVSHLKFFIFKAANAIFKMAVKII